MDNKVELLGYYGSDQIIAQSAWTSTSRDLTPEKIDRIGSMIVGLWANGHETPYEKASVHFLVDTDIASHIHMLKHRMSSMNGESARYKEIKEDKYYLPEDFTNLETNNEVLNKYNKYNWSDLLESKTIEMNELYHECLKDATKVLGRKRAKESARFFKTYNSQIQADIQFNLRSFSNFLRLRDSEHAQNEIREIAQKMHKIVTEIENEPFRVAMWVIGRANELWEEHKKSIYKQIMSEFKAKQ